MWTVTTWTKGRPEEKSTYKVKTKEKAENFVDSLKWRNQSEGKIEEGGYDEPYAIDDFDDENDYYDGYNWLVH